MPKMNHNKLYSIDRPFLHLGSGLKSTPRKASRRHSQRSPTSTLRGNASGSPTLQSPQRIAHANLASGLGNQEPLATERTNRVTVGIDYGTTFTSAAYCVRSTDQESLDVKISDVKTIKNWPGDPSYGLAEQVPTESWYSTVPMDRPPVENQFDPEYTNKKTKEASLLSPDQSPTSDDQDQDELQDTEMGGLDSDDSPEFLWGYAVPNQMFCENTTRDVKRHIERAKLMLVNTPYTQKGRNSLRHKINRLISQGLIRKFGKRDQDDVRDVRDIITDFLIKVLEHIKDQLIIHEGFTEEWEVEFVITVPTAWSSNSSRIMGAVMESAIAATGFGSLKNGSVDNLFIIPEPEAAATWMLGNDHKVMVGETVVILDCGGGTIDAITYKIDATYPLSFGSEIVPPDGDACGGSYLNESFQIHLLQRLKDDHYLEDRGETRETLVNYCIPDFEKIHKRTKDPKKNLTTKIRIPGLKGDHQCGRAGKAARRFMDNYLILNPQDHHEIFDPVLEKVKMVLLKQLEMAYEKGESVQTVFLIGGFAGAPSLRSYLQDFLIAVSDERLNLPYRIRLIQDNRKCVTAVASGAVLRALNKKNGPARHAECSFGFLTWEPLQPGVYQSHSQNRNMAVFDPDDGETYIQVINYFVIKHDFVPPNFTYGPIRVIHTFNMNKEELLCEEVLYVSDTATKSHFCVKNNKNKDAQVAGRIVSDFTFLKKRKGFVLIEPEYDAYGNPVGVPHYRIEYDLMAYVEMRNLRWEAKYPSNKNGKVMGEAQISIAAAFKPGTG